MTSNDELVLDLLTSREFVSQEQVDEIEQYMDKNDTDIIQALSQLNIMPENQVLTLLASEYGMDTFDLTDYQIPEDVVKEIPAEVARRYKIVPLMKNDDTLIVGMADPTDLESLDSLRHILSVDIEPAIVSKKQLNEALSYYYGKMQESMESFLDEVTEGAVSSLGDFEGEDGTFLENAENADDEDAPIIRLVSLIILEAFKSRSSDIHLEPLEKRFRVRYRIDGVLKEVESPPRYLQNNILSRVKIMSRMDISEHRVPQDGRIQINTMGRELDLRVSDIPTTHGESIVMRILDKTSMLLGISELGFLSDDQEIINKIISLPDGLFLVTGPTGSGKTTSLYAFLNTINQPTTKIITVEDPVEYELPGINQVHVRPNIGMTFAASLRAMMRQAPNIIMVGEIRDLETGNIAINAALTGHLVFSTLHTNDAPSAVTRLIDMGVKPFLVSSAVRAIMAQRLVRRVCKSCAQEIEPAPEHLQALRLPENYFANKKVVQGTGCDECNNGYHGRWGIFEIFTLDDQTRELIYQGLSANQIRKHARNIGMRTLREDGLRKVEAGMTTLEEVVRVTASDEMESEY